MNDMAELPLEDLTQEQADALEEIMNLEADRLEINIKPIMVMLDLLNKYWPCQQLLVTLFFPNIHQLCILSRTTYYTVPTAYM